MLHDCFVCIPTCFMCTLIQYLAFLGTNLLTRYHSDSSCFLLFLYFRKVLQEIFSELHGTKTQHLIIPSRSHSQKGSPCGSTRCPDTRPWHVYGPTRSHATPPLCPCILHREKPL